MPIQRSDLDIRISAGTNIGFIVWEAGVPVAGMTSRAELAQWIEDKLLHVEGEAEREAAEKEQFSRMPNVIRPRDDETQARWFGRK